MKRRASRVQFRGHDRGRKRADQGKLEGRMEENRGQGGRWAGQENGQHMVDEPLREGPDRGYNRAASKTNEGKKGKMEGKKGREQAMVKAKAGQGRAERG